MPRMLARAGIVVALLAAPALVFAAADDVSLDTTVVLNFDSGIEVDVTGSTAVVQAISVTNTSFSFDLLDESSIEVTAPNRNILNVDSATDRTINTCTTAASVLKYVGTSSHTVTVTPSNSTCGGTGTVAHSSSSSSSSATPATPVVPTVLPAVPATPSSGLTSSQIQSILAVLTSFDVDAATLASVKAVLEGTTTGSVTSAAVKVFKSNLTTGSLGSEVKMLQEFLNAHGYTIASSGPGSSGNETSTFGGLTRAALVKYQKAKGIMPAVGYFGEKTRASINSEQ